MILTHCRVTPWCVSEEIGEAWEPMKQKPPAVGTAKERKRNMVQVKCISGETGYIETELATELSAGWEIISIETNIYQSYGTLKKDTTVYLKKISN